MKRFTSLIAILFFIAVASVKGDADDEISKFFLSKSDLVVMGRITAEPFPFMDEVGVPNYLCEFQIKDVIKGDVEMKDQLIKLVITRIELVPADKHPLIKKDGECILFLKKAPPQNKPSWVSADFWFSVQHPSPTMAASLKRLAAAK